MHAQSPPRAWVEVDLEAIAHNLDIANQALQGTPLMPVVKAGAYGHGLEPVARRLDRHGSRFFGVANVGEARRLFRAGVRTPSFILGPSFPEEREEIILRDWTCTLSSREEAEHLNSLAQLHGRVLEAHLAIDTGMGREGFGLQELAASTPALQQLSHLRITGIMSHCPVADEDISFTQTQIEHYSQLVHSLRASFPSVEYSHIAASAAQLGYDIPCANLARPGLLLYGVAPLASIYDGVLRPTLRLCARVTLVRELPAGHGVSYGRSYITPTPRKIATIGIGYADGWSRHLSGSPVQCYIRGQACPMVGRVSMDQIMADVSELPEVQSGDIVELINSQQSVVDIARYTQSIPWEVFTGLGPRLPRHYSTH